MKQLFPVLLIFRLFVSVSYAQDLPDRSPMFMTDKPFWQEYHEAYPISADALKNDVRSISVDTRSMIWAATAAGVFRKNNDAAWTAVYSDGPAYSVMADDRSAVWMGAWNGVYKYENNTLKKVDGSEGPVSSICLANEGIYAAGPAGIWIYNGDRFVDAGYTVARSVRRIISDGKEGIWVATDVGLYHCNALRTKHFYDTDILLSAQLTDLGLDENKQLWAAGLGGISILKNDTRQRTITTEQGCPSIYATSVKQAPDGVMWVGTKVGVVRIARDSSRSLRFSQRWLLDDHVRDMAFDSQGNAWIATAKGVSAIKKRKMTLASKQDFFYDALMKRHIRDPWIVGQCHLTVPGRIDSWQPEDDDNDGEYTANYLAMESFRYAVTRSADARQKAEKAFLFLKQLQDVTGSNGFFARSIVPVGWRYRLHDPNRTYTRVELAEELVKEPRFKPVEMRWRPSADGKWLWKGDASSDEMCGHMMGYFFYHELAADKKQKVIIARHVAGIVDHLIDNNFNMMDVDGAHTRWSVWSPDQLNRDPEWLPDRNQNSMELLAFLKLAFYVTGDDKYQQHYLRLIKEEHYLENMAKVASQNPAWAIYFDYILQSYLYPILLHCEKDPQLLAFYRRHADDWMDARKADKNPLINFLYCFARHRKIELDASIDLLTDTPLDLISWTIDHTKREDIQIIRQPILDELQVADLPPASIRSAIRWDKNPWSAVDGYPDMEREPVFWLLPYWMGRYLQMIR